MVHGSQALHQRHFIASGSEAGSRRSVLSAEPGPQEKRIYADSSLGMSLWPSRLVPLRSAAGHSRGPACVEWGQLLLPSPGLSQATDGCSARLRPWSPAGGPPAFSLIDDWMSLSLGKMFPFTFLLACLGRLCAYEHVYMCFSKTCRIFTGKRRPS